MRLVDIDLLPRVIIGAGGEFMQGVQYMREMLNRLPVTERCPLCGAKMEGGSDGQAT